LDAPVSTIRTLGSYRRSNPLRSWGEHVDAAVHRHAGVEKSRRQRLASVGLSGFDPGLTLWALLLVATAADVVTTLYGISAGMAEGNPFVATTLATTGVAGFFVLTAAVLAFGYACWQLLPRSQALAVPTGLALPTALAAGSNAVVLFVL
jgi:hypothetical protein